MKTTILLLSIFTTMHLCAQTKTIYGKFIKNDGTRIKGTSTMKGYEDQLIITNYTGGTDNSATIEIEVPTNTYIAEFRNLMNTPPARSTVAKPAPTVIKPIVATKLPERTIPVQQQPAPQIARVDISVTNRTGNYMPVLSNQIILEDVKVESCTDNAASGTSNIKLKATRIGWVYCSTDAVTGKALPPRKSGWDTASGQSWTGF
ncbi:MAG: hypothetical protein J7578_00455 [Chitinophagaceae bacterium]|nr:hypothetical protein [Chitinophagaceae bacterium]